MSDELNEIFELVPLGLKVIGTIDGQTVKSSKSIDKTIKGMLRNSPATKDFFPKIEEGMDHGIILVGYEDGNKLEFLKSRWRDYRQKSHKKNYLGYTSTKDHKIAVVLDENVTLSGRAIRDIPHTICHECIHLVAYQLWKPFLLTNMKPRLLPFYRTLFESFVPGVRKISDQRMAETITEASKINDNIHQGKPDTQSVFDIWYQLLREVTDDKSADKALLIVFAPYYEYYFNSLKPKYRKYSKIALKAFGQSYKRIGINNVFGMTIPCQEIMFPSEIVCISNQYKPAPENVRLLNNLKFGG